MCVHQHCSAAPTKPQIAAHHPAIASCTARHHRHHHALVRIKHLPSLTAHRKQRAAAMHLLGQQKLMRFARIVQRTCVRVRATADLMDERASLGISWRMFREMKDKMSHGTIWASDSGVWDDWGITLRIDLMDGNSDRQRHMIDAA